MNYTPALAILATLSLLACNNLNGPISSSSDFDPLRAPGGSIGKGSQNSGSSSAGSSFKPGQFVRAGVVNTAFFKKRPNGDADADKLLKRGTSMKIISSSSSYTKVELDSGEVGFVPTVVLEDPATSSAASASAPRKGEYQVYPPLPSNNSSSSYSTPSQPLPPIDPAGLPPEGAIPTVIEPDAPSTTAPSPTTTTPLPTIPSTPEKSDVPPIVQPKPTVDPGTPAPIIEPKPDSVPLPPNGE
jgi:hypothetical protein